MALTVAAVTGVMADDVKTYEKPIDTGRLVCEIAALVYATGTFVEEAMQLYL